MVSESSPLEEPINISIINATRQPEGWFVNASQEETDSKDIQKDVTMIRLGITSSNSTENNSKIIHFCIILYLFILLI